VAAQGRQRQADAGRLVRRLGGGGGADLPGRDRTDTGGSIRQPAAFTGTVGIKPTYGRCSRWGIVAFASSLDQAGPIARTVRDAPSCCAIDGGHDPKDSTSLDAVPDFEAVRRPADQGHAHRHAEGVPRRRHAAGDRGAVAAGHRLAEGAGAEIVEISLPHTKYALPAYYIVAPAEASSNLARYDGVRYGLRVPGKD
jgi:aspartyl-tRNA(Asn)/glutamyl-tRNA(Gln) amidotransferase subunit A